MDSDLWASQAAAKRHYLLEQQQSSNSDRFDDDGYEFEGVRSNFLCPFCDEYYGIASLCSHLEDEHPFESKAAVCPVCSVNVTGEMLSHIWLQHGQAFILQKHRWLCRAAIHKKAEETSKYYLSHVDDFIGKKSTTKTGNSSIDLSLSQEEREKKQRQATVRAKFVQDLLLSTIFDD